MSLRLEINFSLSKKSFPTKLCCLANKLTALYIAPVST